MPHRRRSTAPAEATRQRSFRQRYNDVEARRAALMTRLQALGKAAERHPGYSRALRLLNHTFRKSKLAQRVAVLEAAAWLISVLEKLTIAAL
ncbi:MAG: hypothetical protein ACK4UO_13130 [Pseudolabrys sp.]